ncbi:Hypothetical protein NTJ_05917 [Nesidiocoris tenuis]|uniref:Uncharacterized protein n=1 Tax=Nesidiocoris tenuis TaxID=355587 RepID=A0ABN7AM41_9HEMI|nr:Hypothetical protein NTJ_05917 [Nesidiocoris tenuis]
MLQMKKIALFATLLAAFQHVSFARYNSGWSAGWTWGGSGSNEGGRSSDSSVATVGLSDADLISMLYSSGSSSIAHDHPSLPQRIEYRRSYEVTEAPESDYDGVDGYDPRFDGHELQYQDNSILQSPDNARYLKSNNQPHLLQETPYASSSSTFMSGSNGNIIHAEYSTKIIHDPKL